MYTDKHVSWAPERPVYKHVTKNRYIFWNAHGYGWCIGPDLSSSYFATSKSNFNYVFKETALKKKNIALDISFMA